MQARQPTLHESPRRVERPSGNYPELPVHMTTTEPSACRELLSLYKGLTWKARDCQRADHPRGNKRKICLSACAAEVAAHAFACPLPPSLSSPFKPRPYATCRIPMCGGLLPSPERREESQEYHGGVLGRQLRRRVVGLQCL